MAWGLPSGSGRSRKNARAAERRVKKGSGTALQDRKAPVKGAGPALQDRPPAVAPGAPGAPGAATHAQQPTSSPQPTNVLGGSSAPSGTSYVGGTQVNTHQVGRPTATGLGGAARVGKRFTVGFDRAGNIVHLYGSDVPADQRRQVLK